MRNLSESLLSTFGFRFVDRARPRTELQLVITDHRTGKSRAIFLGENIITDLGRSNMAHILAGDDAANRIVTEVRFGDGGHTVGDPTTPLAPSASDTDLNGSTIIVKATSFDFPDGSGGSKVRFTATVAANEGNGSGSQAYSEVGLYDQTGRMMTHKTFGLVTKSDAFSIAINYTILF
jgi:hypothetical protein